MVVGQLADSGLFLAGSRRIAVVVLEPKAARRPLASVQYIYKFMTGRNPVTDENILTRPSDAELAAAVEENLFAFFRAMAALPGGKLSEGDLISYHLAFPSNPMFKGVWQLRLDPSNAEAVIDETLAWFKEQQASFSFWWTGPGTTPNDLGERLVARGLIAVELDAPGMVADLQAMNEAALTTVSPEFTVEEVRDENSLKEFKGVLVEAYEAPDALAQGWVDATQRFGIGRTPWQFFLGRLAGKPVATNIVFTGAGVAGVYGIGTIPSARGQGIGGAITLQPLLATRARGYHHAVLFSSEIGIHAYERIGFRHCGVRISRYLWRNE
jgi:ribosomal protein S18 acetylase RimI-like enzyme